MLNNRFVARILIALLPLIIGVSGITIHTQGQRPSSKPAARPTIIPDNPSSEPQGLKPGTFELRPEASEALLESIEKYMKCDPSKQEHLSLLANLEGQIKFTGREGKGSLKIVDHNFTLKIDETTTLQGLVTATRTCDHTAFALTFDAQSRAVLRAANMPDMGISLYAQQCGNGLMLTAVPEENRTFVFRESSAKGGCSVYCPRPPCPKGWQGRR